MEIISPKKMLRTDEIEEKIRNRSEKERELSNTLRSDKEGTNSAAGFDYFYQ